VGAPSGNIKHGVPQYLAHALRRQPVLLADLLAIHNRCQRLRHEPRTLLIWLVAATLGVLLVLAIASNVGTWRAESWRWVMTQGSWLAAAAALYAAVQVMQRRSAVERHYGHSWLIAAAHAAPALRSGVMWRTLWPLGLQLALAAAGLLSIGTLHPALTSVWPLIAWMAGGMLAGASAGWWLGGVRVATHPVRYEDSRYTLRAPRRASRGQPTLLALSIWPIARALAWHRPANIKLVLLAFILLMPAGTSAQSGACVVLIGLLMSYASALVRAVLQTAVEAARWLQATPIRWPAFAGPIMRRAVLHQAVLVLSIAILLLPLGAAPIAVLYLALLWVVLVSMAWTLWLRACFYNERALFKVIIPVAAALALEQLLRGCGILGAVLWTTWNLRARTP
jgi:hypothetical protein